MVKPKSKARSVRKKKKNKPDSESKPKTPPSNWVRGSLDWLEGEREDDDEADISIVSWNVLADSYCSPRSHPKLPRAYSSSVFHRERRQNAVRQSLRHLATNMSSPPDCLALQEVDAPIEVRSCLEELGYEGIETPKVASGNDGRVDSCALYYNPSRWSCLGHQFVHMDDLATMRSNSVSDDTQGAFKPSAAANNLQGIQSSFVRRNQAMLVKLQRVDNPKQIVVVAVAHLYWNPAYEYVKLCQMHYLMQRSSIFCENKKIPLIVCGDLNSQPGSFVHQYLVNGVVNAKSSAPWYRKEVEEMEEFKEDGSDSDTNPSTTVSLVEAIDELAISEEGEEDADETQTQTLQIRYLLDFTLNRLCRWLRILGIDALLETKEEERLRTKEDNLVIFDRCKKESRTLVTTSSKLILRSSCPPGAYLLTPKSLENLEVAMVHILLSHGVSLVPSNFLSRCVVCNGHIGRVHDAKQKEAIFNIHKSSEKLNEEVLEVFQCGNCQQGYWWCDRPTSSASRVKNQATHLLEMCIRGGVPIVGGLAMFDYIDVADLQRQGVEGTTEESVLLRQQLDVLDWLKRESLSNPFGALTSAYAGPDRKETLPYTNITYFFKGHLDYVLFNSDHIRVVNRLYVPTTYRELNPNAIPNGYLLPSNVWPSDHLAVGARLALMSSEESEEPKNLDEKDSDIMKSIGETEEPSAASKANIESKEETVTPDATDMFCAPLGSAPPPHPPVVPASSETEEPSLVSTANTDSREETIVSDATDMFCAPLGSAQPPPSPPPPVIPTVLPNNHGQRCACGCVPKVPSLFEMAELRRLARLKRGS